MDDVRAADTPETGRDRTARTSELFRGVNNWIRRLPPAGSDGYAFLCECDDPECRRTMRLTAAEYRAVRAHPLHFAVLPEHVGRGGIPVHRNERFAVVRGLDAARDGVATRRRRRG